MAKNNYLHMKLRESREEIARLKEELEASEKASQERERETAGKAAEQIEREQETARGERARVLEQLESAEADREQVATQLREAEERQQQERERRGEQTTNGDGSSAHLNPPSPPRVVARRLPGYTIDTHARMAPTSLQAHHADRQGRRSRGRASRRRAMSRSS